jgi:hypothetical protein
MTRRVRVRDDKMSVRPTCKMMCLDMALIESDG